MDSTNAWKVTNNEHIAISALKRTMLWESDRLYDVDHLNFSNGLINSAIPKQISPPVDDTQESYEDIKEELNQTIEGSNDVLVIANSAFTIFKDTVVLDRAKLTITRRTFFRSSEIMSISISDVLNVTATIGPFFGYLIIMSRILNNQPYIIGKFTRSDTLRLKRVIQGYIIALQRGIDCNTMPTKELIDLIYQVGVDEHTNKQ